MVLGPQLLKTSQFNPLKGKRSTSCILGLDVWCVGCGSALTRRSAPSPPGTVMVRKGSDTDA